MNPKIPLAIAHLEASEALLKEMQGGGRLKTTYLRDIRLTLELLREMMEEPAPAPSRFPTFAPRLDDVLRPLVRRLVEADPEQGSLVIGLDPEMINGPEGRLKCRIFAGGKFLELRFKDAVLDDQKLAGDFFERIVSTFLSGKFEDPAFVEKFGKATIWGLPLASLPGFESVTDPNEANEVIELIRSAVDVATNGGRLSEKCRAFLLTQSALLDPTKTEAELFRSYGDQDLARLYIEMMEAFIASQNDGGAK